MLIVGRQVLQEVYEPAGLGIASSEPRALGERDHGFVRCNGVAAHATATGRHGMIRLPREEDPRQPNGAPAASPGSTIYRTSPIVGALACVNTSATRATCPMQSMMVKRSAIVSGNR